MRRSCKVMSDIYKNMAVTGKQYVRGLLLMALAFFTFLMIRLTLPYTAMRNGVSFLHSKQRVYHLGYWRISFYTHVFTSCLC